MDIFLNELERLYPRLSKGQKRIADFILHSCEDAAFMTAAKIGERTGVSESTVVRFAYALGLDGFPALQTRMQEFVRHRLTSLERIRMASGIPQNEVLRSTLTSDMNNLRMTIERMDNEVFTAAVDALLSAKKVYVLGVRSTAALAQFFYYYLDYVCDNVMPVMGTTQNVFDKLVRVGPSDVLFGISFPRYSSVTVRAMRSAKQRGATVIALTDQADSPLARIADYTLYARSDMASFADSLVAPLSVINALLVAVGRARNDEAMRHLACLEEVWRNEGVYLGDEPGATP